MTGPQLLALLKKNPVSSICALLSLVLVVAMYFRSDALTTAEDELKEKTALGERYTANLNHSAKLKEDYDTLVAANKDIEDRLVRVSELAPNLQYFYKLEAETGVKMKVDQETKQAATTTAGGKKVVMPVAFSVSVQGDYNSVIEFLRRVEEGAHFSRMVTCVMSSSGVAGVDTGQARIVTLTLSLELLGQP